MSIFKKGVRFISQDTNEPIQEEEIPFILSNLTSAGLLRAAMVGFAFMHAQGFSINRALEVMSTNEKEDSK
jgi:hypothetical protein